MEIPFKDFGGEGNFIHFAHANAYHPGAYRQLLNPLLSTHRVQGMLFRPFWKGVALNSAPTWKTHAHDLLSFLDKHGHRNVIGIGHSLGAVSSLLAAAKRPELFRALILLEPVILPPKVYRFTGITPRFIRRRIIPPARISAKRRDTWSSKREAYNHLRKKRVFKRISEEVFADMMEHGIVELPDNTARLSFSKEWETHIYSTSANPWRAIRKLDCPVMIVRGAETNVILPEAWQLLQQTWPSGQFMEIPETGHLVPFEAPEQVTRDIQSFLKAL